MNVLLHAAVKGLGRAGEVVSVSDAHARNFLFPRKLAEPATAAIVAKQKTAQQQSIAQAAAQIAALRQLAGRLQDAQVTIHATAHPQGKLFAAVKAADIQRAVEQQFAVHLGQVHMYPDHLKTVGQHRVEMRVSGEALQIIVNVQHG